MTALAGLLTYVPVQNLSVLITSGELMPWDYESDLDLFSLGGFSIRPGALIWMTSKDYPDVFGNYYPGRFVTRCLHYDGTEDYAVRVPLVIPLVIFLIYPSTVLVERLVRGRSFPPGHCVQCGYSLTGNVSGVCPECGAPRKSDTSETEMLANMAINIHLRVCGTCGGDARLFTLRPLWLLVVGLGIPGAWYVLSHRPPRCRLTDVAVLLGTAVTSAVFLALFIERAIVSTRGWFRICRCCGGTGQQPRSQPEGHAQP